MSDKGHKSQSMKRHLLFLVMGTLSLAPLQASEPEHGAKKGGPRDVLWRLRQGNQAYAAGKLKAGAGSPARRSTLVAGQHPHAVILTCADSRVPPEYIFQEDLGSLFVVRVAGVVADPVVVGSVEYAAEHLHTPLIVVMGHTKCGAVKAAIETPAPATPGGPGVNIESILALLRPGLQKGVSQPDPWTTAVYGGVEQSVNDLHRLSKLIPEMEKEGHVGVVGAVYELETGKVVFSDMVAAGHSIETSDRDRVVSWGGGEAAPAPTPVPVKAKAKLTTASVRPPQ
jgi:carbonic anhydrase